MFLTDYKKFGIIKGSTNLVKNTILEVILTMVIIETALIVIGAICALASMGFTIKLARAKQTHTAAVGAILTVILVASLIGCSTLVH